MFQAYDNYFDWDLVPTTGFVEESYKPLSLVATYDPALELLDEDEGGYVNHPQDKGGPTNKGITIGTFRRYIKANATIDDLKAITNEQVRVIYKRGFWDTIHGDELPSGLDYAVFDFSVNSGPSRALKYLQISLQHMGLYKGAIDGLIGPQTHKAIQSANIPQLIDILCDYRQKFVRSLSTYAVFGKGWERRIAGVRKDAKGLVGKSPTVTTPVAEKNFLDRLIEAILQLLNGPIISTLFRYALVFIGGTVVAQGWFTVDEWAQISAAVTAFGLAVWGVIEARKSKVVVNGTRVPLAELPPTTQNAVKSSVAAVENQRKA